MKAKQYNIKEYFGAPLTRREFGTRVFVFTLKELNKVLDYFF